MEEIAVNVGIRELRAGLSRYMALVREGQEITVTDRGTPVAVIRPVDADDRYQRLIDAGILHPARRPHGPLPEPLDIPGLDLREFLDRR